MSNLSKFKHWIFLTTASFLLSLLFIAHYGDFFNYSAFHFNSEKAKKQKLFIRKWNLKIEQNKLYLIQKNNQYFVSRCIAMPGDTFEIRNGKFFLNNKQFYPPQIQYFYEFISEKSLIDSAEKYHVTYNETNAEGLYIHRAILAPGYQSYFAGFPFVFSSKRINQSWEGDLNIDFFGPVIIPRKNRTIEIDSEQLPFYQLLTSEEIKIKSSGKIELSATKNYYFFLNDIQNLTSDSRVHGFIEELQIVGSIGNKKRFN